MGNYFGGLSNSRKHCLVEFPHVQTRKAEAIVSIRLELKYTPDGTDCYLVPEAKYPYDEVKQSCYFMPDMASELKTNEKAIIMGVFLLFVQNELQIPLLLTIRNLFSVDEHILNKKNHPDNTGKLTIMMEGQQRGLQPSDKQMLYLSTAENDGALSYAGLEDRLLQPHSIPIPTPPAPSNNPFDGKQEEEHNQDEEKEKEEDAYELFTDEDEMIKFILQNKQLFSPSSSDMYKVEFDEKDPTKDITHYHVSKAFLEKVRSYFRDAIFPCLHYTNFVDTRLDLSLTQEQRHQLASLHPPPSNSRGVSPSVFFTLQFNYIIITTGGAKVTPKAVKRHY